MSKRHTITIKCEAGGDMETVIQALNVGDVGIKLDRYEEGAFHFVVSDRQAVKAVADAIRANQRAGVTELNARVGQ